MPRGISTGIDTTSRHSCQTVRRAMSANSVMLHSYKRYETNSDYGKPSSLLLFDSRGAWKIGRADPFTANSVNDIPHVVANRHG